MKRSVFRSNIKIEGFGRKTGQFYIIKCNSINKNLFFKVRELKLNNPLSSYGNCCYKTFLFVKYYFLKIMFQMAAIVVTYLKKHTEFFTWFLKQEHHPADNMDGLVNHVGGFIAKHIAQFTCNSSIIEHWAYPSTDEIFPNDLISVACGIFPSVSIMNHSCRPNITNL